MLASVLGRMAEDMLVTIAVVASVVLCWVVESLEVVWVPGSVEVRGVIGSVVVCIVVVGVVLCRVEGSTGDVRTLVCRSVNTAQSRLRNSVTDLTLVSEGVICVFKGSVMSSVLSGPVVASMVDGSSTAALVKLSMTSAWEPVTTGVALIEFALRTDAAVSFTVVSSPLLCADVGPLLVKTEVDLVVLSLGVG